jgi:prolyl 4-hydroxylase
MASAVSTGCAGPSSSDTDKEHAAAPAGAVACPSSDLRHFIRVYDDDLPIALCARMVASFHALARRQQRNGRGIRAGLDDSAWTELDVGRYADDGFLRFFRARIDTALARYNRDTQLPIAVPDSPLLAPLVMKRYAAGGQDRFQLHFDAVGEVCERYLVFLWYLNDIDDGGETRFPSLDLRIPPRAGRLLVFPPYWMYPHQGCPSPTRDKYIVSTYLRFPRAQSSA